jgi:hypothetical protein
MSFVHDDKDFEQLLAIVARDTGISEALIEMTAAELARDMVANKGMRALPSSDEPVLRLDDVEKREVIEKAHAKIAPMFWGERIGLDEACHTIHAWLGRQEWATNS